MTEAAASSAMQFILLVEDNPADANLIEEALAEEQLPTALHVVADGEKAIEFLDRVDAERQPRPDLVLLDLNLPRLSGRQVLTRIRRSPKCAGTKVLIVSSSDAPSDREQAMALGATDYFRKPSNLDQFMKLGSVVRNLLVE